jgi:hypothetical protein
MLTIASDNLLPVPASLLPNASLRESLNREDKNRKLDLSAMSLVIQGFKRSPTHRGDTVARRRSQPGQRHFHRRAARSEWKISIPEDEILRRLARWFRIRLWHVIARDETVGCFQEF